MFRLNLLGTDFEAMLNQRLQQGAHDQAYAHVMLSKTAARPETVQSLVGTLYLSQSGWILLNVPNALGRGAFAALNEPGIELPRQSNGLYNAHLTVFRPEEIAKIGGPDKISERGHQFHYTLGPVQTVKPSGWPEVSKAWFLTVRSAELERLRRSYGLSSLPKNGQHAFHITFAIRKANVLGHNAIGKGV